MVELLRHRQTKGAATDRLYLRPPRHISTLPYSVLHQTLIKEFANWRETTQTGSTGFLLKGQESTDSSPLVDLNISVRLAASLRCQQGMRQVAVDVTMVLKLVIPGRTMLGNPQPKVAV
jgi:hypothetical protein